MNLNPDCLADILAYAESNACEDCPWVVSEHLPIQLSVYVHDEVRQHVRQCIRAGYLDCGAEWIDGTFEILGISAAGRRALDAIRHPVVRDKTNREWPAKVADGLVTSSISGFVSWALETLKNAVLS